MALFILYSYTYLTFIIQVIVNVHKYILKGCFCGSSACIFVSFQSSNTTRLQDKAEMKRKYFINFN